MGEKEDRSRISTLRTLMRQYDHAYCIDKVPVVDDEVYDLLKAELRELERQQFFNTLRGMNNGQERRQGQDQFATQPDPAV